MKTAILIITLFGWDSNAIQTAQFGSMESCKLGKEKYENSVDYSMYRVYGIQTVCVSNSLGN